jgi:hypothetical protein
MMPRARFLLITTLIVSAALNVARSQDNDPDHDDDAIALLQSAMRSRIVIGYNQSGRGVLAYHCRHAKEGCERRLSQFAHYLVDASQAHGIDPWLMAAMALKESGLNPFAKGPAGELGILQIHPKRRDALHVRFIRDEWYRLRCRREPGACQREIVDHAARVLARSVEMCGGDIKGALGLYNTGRCGGSRAYAKRILLERGEMLRAVGLDAQAAAPQAQPQPQPDRS